MYLDMESGIGLGMGLHKCMDMDIDMAFIHGIHTVLSSADTR